MTHFDYPPRPALPPFKITLTKAEEHARWVVGRAVMLLGNRPVGQLSRIAAEVRKAYKETLA